VRCTRVVRNSEKYLERGKKKISFADSFIWFKLRLMIIIYSISNDYTLFSAACFSAFTWAFSWASTCTWFCTWFLAPCMPSFGC